MAQQASLFGCGSPPLNRSRMTRPNFLNLDVA